MKLNEISDNPGAAVRKVRVGRGPGSGLGKTSGVGIKGQKSRSGVAINGFEGGQMPLHRRLPKRGFNPLVRSDFAVINLGDLQRAVDAGKLDANATVTYDVLRAAGIVGRARDGVRVLAKGDLTAKLSLDVAGASAAAVAAIEKIGGKIIVPAKAE